MLTLVRLSADDYVVSSEKEGITMRDLSEKEAIIALLIFGIADDQIEEAILGLDETQHSIAEFGTFGNFLFTREAVGAQARAV